MENIRNIKEKIQSCIFCNEEQCPIIRERLDQHMMSCHSSNKRSYSNQQIDHLQKCSGTNYKMNNFLPNTSDGQTSMGNLSEIDSKSGIKNNYENALWETISECTKNMPLQQAGPDENKQNVINKFIERIQKLHHYKNEKLYNSQLRSEIDQFIDYFSLINDDQGSVNENDIKEQIFDKINILKNKYFKADAEKANGVISKSISTESYYSHVNYSKDAGTYTSQTDILYSPNYLYDDSLQSLIINKDKLVHGVDKEIQVEQVLIDSDPVLGNNINSKTSEIVTKSDKFVLKNLILNRLLKLNNELNLNITKTDISSLTVVLENNLLLLLDTPLNIQLHKQLLQEKILNFLFKHVTFPITYSFYLKEFADKLATTILTRKFSPSNIIIKNIESENNIHITVQDNECDNLEIDQIDETFLNHNSDKKFNVENTNEFSNQNRVISVFKSENDLRINNNNNKTSSTSSIARKVSSIVRKKSPKLKSEEKVYKEKLGVVIRSWLNALPKNLQSTKGKKLKEQITNNLISDLLDLVKLEQQAPEISNDKDKYMNFLIFRCLNKIQIYDDINDIKPYIEQLRNKIYEIPIPLMEKFNYDIALKKSQLKEIDSNILHEDENVYKNIIFNWLHEIPNTLITNSDESLKDKIIEKLAFEIKCHVQNGSLEQITQVINNWLETYLQPNEHPNISNSMLTEKLIKRLSIPSLLNELNKKEVNRDNVSLSKGTNNLKENDLKDLIEEYLEHSYDTDNMLAREAFSRIFKYEFEKLCPKLDENKTACYQYLTLINKLSNELEYSNVITKWFKKLQLSESFNSGENLEHANLVASLVKAIGSFEDNADNLARNEYEDNLQSIIKKFTIELPLSSQSKSNINFIVDDLLKAIIIARNTTNQNMRHENLENCTGQNLSDVIEEFIRENSQDITEDELKLDACVLRLCEEIDKLTNKNTSNCSKSATFNRLDISMPSNKLCRRFSFEIRYAKEIADWLNNFSLKTDKSSQDDLIKMVSALAVKMAEIYEMKKRDPDNTRIDSHFDNYLERWISLLPFDSNNRIVVPMMIKQIKNCTKRINNQKIEDSTDIRQASLEPADITSNKRATSTRRKNVVQENENDLSNKLIEVLEKWHNNLPKAAKPEIITKSLKNYIISQILYGIGQLDKNCDYLSNILGYELQLSKIIDLELKKLSKCTQLHSDTDILKKNIIEMVKKSKENTLEVDIYDRIPNFDSKFKSAADIILEIVETWCHQLPLQTDTSEESDAMNKIKDNLVIKIIMKIGELNINPETFNDDFLYDAILDDAIDKLLANLPTNDMLIKTSNERKQQLKNAIKSVKPMIKREKERYEYKIQLNNTIRKILVEPQHENAEENAIYSNLTEDITDNFIIYKFSMPNQKNSEIYKASVCDAVRKYYSLIDADSDKQNNAWIKVSQITNALSKISAPKKTAIAKEIREIRIKFELTQFFDRFFEIKYNENNTLKSQVKTTLAKRLSDLSSDGDSIENYIKMKQETLKCLKKIDDNIDTEKVEQFIKRLSNSKSADESFSLNKNGQHTYTRLQLNDVESEPKQQERKLTKTDIDQQWFSLLPSDNHEKFTDIPEYTKTNSTTINTDSNKYQQSYNDFENGVEISSSKHDKDSSSFSETFNEQKFRSFNNSIRENVPSHVLQDLNKTVATDHTFVEQLQSENSKTSQQSKNIKNNNTSNQVFSKVYSQQTPLLKEIDSQTQEPINLAGSQVFDQYSQNEISVPQQNGTQTENFEQTHPNAFLSKNTQRLAEQRTPISSSVNQSPFHTIPVPSTPSNVPSTSRFIPQRRISYANNLCPPCRRPSIRIFDPKEVCEGKSLMYTAKGCNTEVPITEDGTEDLCECFRHRYRQNVCSVHMRRHCRICNGGDPFYCRMPSHRYPGYYY